MYCIAVCEDEPLIARQNVQMTCHILDGRGMVRDRDYRVDTFCAAAPLLEKFDTQPRAYDLLLLDIDLADGSGLDLAGALRERRVTASVLYITGYQEFTAQALHTRAVDYLLKPVDEEKLAAALEWDLRVNYRPERPVLHTGKRAIPLPEILYLEIDGRKTAVHLEGGVELLPEPLSKVERPLLGQGFSHSHFSYLVNLARVDRVERTLLTLDTGERIPVSRRYYQTLMDQYIDFMK